MLSDAEQQSLLTQVQRVISSPDIPSNAVSVFIVQANATTGGIDVGFEITDITGIASVTLLRASVMDANVAIVIQTWSPAAIGDYTFPDASNVAALPKAFYWLRLEPTGTSGTSFIVGPQSVDLNPDTTQPSAPTGISVSHDNLSNGTVRVFVNVSGVDSTENSIRVYVSGYQGNPSPVAVASVSKSPAQFVLQATGETVSITAVQVSPSGVVSDPSPAVSLTLSSSRTPPAAPNAPTVVQFSGGNQISWQSSAESWVTGYGVYRGQRGQDVGTFTLLATVTASTESTMNYTDTAGLGGDYAYSIVAQSTAGDSARSDAGFPARTYSAITLPPNVSANQTNDATVDSVSASGSALIRIYGPGGIGTGYTRTLGGASLPRPNGTISGNAYKTLYAVVYDTVTFAYLAFLMTDYPSTLPDNYEFVGYYTTVSTGSAPGSGATATAVIDGTGHVIQINVTASGSGYDAAQVNIAGGGGSGAQAEATLAFFGHGVSSITVTNGGSGYLTVPTVTIVAIDPGTQPGGGGSSPIYVGGVRFNSNPDTFDT